jgi:hypothetical protein
VSDVFSRAQCDRNHDSVDKDITESRKYTSDVERRLSVRIDKLDSKLWGLIVVGLTNLGGIIAIFLKAII